MNPRKLTDAQVVEVRRLLSKHVPAKEIAAQFGVTYQTVNNIRLGNGPTYSPNKDEHPDERAIRVMHLRKRTPVEIADALGYPTAQVSSLLRKQGLLPPLPPYVKPLPPWKPLPGIRTMADQGVDEALLRRMHRDGLTPDEMQERSGFDTSYLSSELKRLGLSPHAVNWGSRAFAEDVARKVPGDWYKANRLRWGHWTVKP